MVDAQYPNWGLGTARLAAKPSGRVRVQTLTNLRWMSIGGQAVAIFIVYFGFRYDLPFFRALICVLASVALNLFMMLRYGPNERLSNREATVYLGFDILQLTFILYLTGGISNPFSIMYIAPVLIAAATLNLTHTMILGGLAVAAGSLIAVLHEPLPWSASAPFVMPPLYQAGMWASLMLSLGFTSVYVWRIASEGARMSAGLAASQLALAREQRMASLGALAASAAHELGTPLGTIAVVSHELERALPAGSDEAMDAALLREQAERCRTILMRLANPEAEMVDGINRLPICAFLDDLADDFRDDEVDVVISVSAANRDMVQPQIWRGPELIHGLSNIIDNAVDFAATRVRIGVAWNDTMLRVDIDDDGPGFSPEIFQRIGEPYTTSRPGYNALEEGEFSPEDSEAGRHEGMGLGFFIAKTLLERTGGKVQAVNPADGGARVTVIWPRGGIDGETSSLQT